MTSFYASPNGVGNGLTPDSPASLASVRTLVQAALSSDNVALYLRGGTYRLSEALILTSADSGQGGYTVVWCSYPGDPPPVISGAIKITGWTLHDAAKNIWKASVPVGTVTRQLYVNGTRATRAYLTSPNRFTTSDNGLTFTATDSTIPTIAVPTDLEISNAALPWAGNRVSVASVSRVGSTTTLIMDNSVASWNAQAPSYATWGTSPMSVENAYEFLSATSTGCWYLNTSTNTLYYVPRAGEDMATADVELPVLTTLLSSSQSSPVSNIRFTGIVFEGAGWILPSTQRSFLQTQANQYMVKGSWGGNINGYLWTNPWLTPPSPAYINMAFPPGAVSLEGAQSAVFTSCTFRHMGASAVYIGKGSKNCTVDRCTITDVSANGIHVGDTTNWAPVSSDQVSYITVTNNTITNVATEYQGGVGIFVGFVDHTKVNHNDIFNLSYTAISFGWGWNTTGFTNGYANNNEVGWNSIHSILQLLSDGGGIYVTGSQGSPGNLMGVHDNYIYDFSVKTGNSYHTGYGGAPIYSETGSGYVSYYNNVISRNPASNISYWSHYGTSILTINASNNFATSGTTANMPEGWHNDGSVSTPTWFIGTEPTGWPSAAQSISAAAGVQPDGATTTTSAPGTTTAAPGAPTATISATVTENGTGTTTAPATTTTAAPATTTTAAPATTTTAAPATTTTAAPATTTTAAPLPGSVGFATSSGGVAQYSPTPGGALEIMTPSGIVSLRLVSAPGAVEIETSIGRMSIA